MMGREAMLVLQMLRRFSSCVESFHLQAFGFAAHRRLADALEF